MEVKLYEHEGELYVWAKSSGRRAKEIALRRKRLARLTLHAPGLTPAAVFEKLATIQMPAPTRRELSG